MNSILKKTENSEEQKAGIERMKKLASERLSKELIYDFLLFQQEIDGQDYEIPSSIPMPEDWRSVRGLAVASWFEFVNDYPVKVIAVRLLQKGIGDRETIYSHLLKGLALISLEDHSEISSDWIDAVKRRDLAQFNSLRFLSQTIKSNLNRFA